MRNRGTNPCPFCGLLSTHVLGPTTSPNTSTHAKGYQVECINCGARGPCGMANSKSAVLVWDRGDCQYRRPILSSEYVSEVEYTPGPWVANGDKIETESAIFRARIAIIDDGSGIEDPDANANLVSAAPDMYEALNRIYNKLLISDRDGESHISEKDGEMALAALCKARGEA